MNYSDKFFSIIIIFHNSEKNIKKCLESVLNQNKIELCQVVMVNDCSEDNSLCIVQDVLANYSVDYILFSNKKQLGISASRQKGLDLSNGQYIYYIDSDDYIDNSFIEFSYNFLLNNSKDIVFFDYYMEYSNKQILKRNQKILINEIDKDIISGEIYGFLWNKIIRRELFFENNIMFAKNVDMWEDSLITAKLCSKTNCISYCEKAYLHYVQNEVSCVHKKMNDVIATSMQLAIEDFSRFFKNDIFQESINLRIVEYHITMFLRADYAMYLKYVKQYPIKMKYVFQARQYNFFLKLTYALFKVLPTKINFYLLKGGYIICTKIVKKNQKN